MTEQQFKKPKSLMVDGAPFVQWLIQNISELAGTDISSVPYEWEIRVAPLVAYIDQILEDFDARIAKLSRKIGSPIEPSSCVDESLTTEQIGKLPKEERTKELRKLILKDDYTTLRISKRIHKRLSKLGSKGDSFDTIIEKIVKKVEGENE